MKAQTKNQTGKLRMPKDKFVKDEYTNGSALYSYIFGSKLKNSDESKLNEINKIFGNIRKFKSPNSFEIMKESIGKQIDYIHCENSDLQDEIKQSKEDMLVTKFHKKEPDITPYLRIKQLESQQPMSYIKKITEMNQVLDKFDNMFSDIQQHKDVYKRMTKSVGRVHPNGKRFKDTSNMNDAVLSN